MENDENIDWEDITETLLDEKCILFIGPHALTYKNNLLLEEELLAKIDVHNPDHPYIQSFYDDGFFLFKEPQYKRRIVREIRKFYRKVSNDENPLLEKIAQIPFHLIVNLGFTNLLIKVFDKLNVNYDYDYFDMGGQKPLHFTRPNKNVPLVYNLFGNIEIDETIILTHKDLYSYLQAIFQSKNFKEEFKEEFSQAHSYIFLGLPFEKWYMQLLLHLLVGILVDDPDKQKMLDKFSSKPKNDYAEKFFKEQFNLKFIPSKTGQFIDHLFDYCKDQGVLRKPSLNKVNRLDAEEIISLMKEAEYGAAMENLERFLKTKKPASNELLQSLTLKIGKFKELKHKSILGITEKEDDTEKKKLLFDILQLIEEAKKI